MTGIAKRTKLAAAVALALLGGDGAVLYHGSIVSPAEAVIGRPATPLSYAGVARRTTRRAIAVDAAVAPRCVQVVDAYGRIVTRCY